MVTFADIESAAERISGASHRTPVMTSSTFDGLFGNRTFFKCENFQRAGAFKFRGAYNSLSLLTPEQRSRGVLTFSSGNHAQALALAGRVLGISVVVVMPDDAPAVKRSATEAYGAEVILYDREEENREELGRKLSSERGLTLIPPYDFANVIAGAGTAVKELIEEVGDLDVVLVPCGGGGLLAGTAIAAKHLCPDCKVIGVEPEAGNDGCQSFKTGVIHKIDNPITIADGARTPYVGALNFEIMREKVDDMVYVNDTVLLQAVEFYWTRMKLMVEPTGALSLAAIWDGAVSTEGKRVGVIISGGNCDPAAVAKLFGS